MIVLVSVPPAVVIETVCEPIAREGAVNTMDVEVFVLRITDCPLTVTVAKPRSVPVTVIVSSDFTSMAGDTLVMLGAGGVA